MSGTACFSTWQWSRRRGGRSSGGGRGFESVGTVLSRRQGSAPTGQPAGRADRPLSRVDQPLTITAITIDDNPRPPVAATRILSILSALLLVTDTDTDMAVQSQGCVPTLYCRRCPADTPLYRVVQNHLETFLSRGRDEWWEATANRKA